MTDPKSNQPSEISDDDLDTAAGGAQLGYNLHFVQTQTVLENKSKQYGTVSNVLKKSSDTSSTIIGNIK